MFQVADVEEEDGEDELPSVTYEEMKQLMSKLGGSGEEMYKLRKSLLHHLDALIEDGLITFNLVHSILYHTYENLAFHDSATTELVTMIIVKFHIKIEGLKNEIA